MTRISFQVNSAFTWKENLPKGNSPHSLLFSKKSFNADSRFRQSHLIRSFHSFEFSKHPLQDIYKPNQTIPKRRSKFVLLDCNGSATQDWLLIRM